MNIRGLGQKGRSSQLVEMVHKYQVEGVCLQETLKKNFTDRELANLCRGLQFNWSWIPTSGHSGGLLLGVKEDNLEVIREVNRSFSQSVLIRQKDIGSCWELVNVYGPVMDNKKSDFLGEMSLVVEEAHESLLIRGDFNLVRGAEEKSTEQISATGNCTESRGAICGPTTNQSPSKWCWTEFW